MAAKLTNVSIADRLSNMANSATMIALAAFGEGAISGQTDDVETIANAARELAASLHEIANEIALARA